MVNVLRMSVRSRRLFSLTAILALLAYAPGCQTAADSSPNPPAVDVTDAGSDSDVSPEADAQPLDSGVDASVLDSSLQGDVADSSASDASDSAHTCQVGQFECSGDDLMVCDNAQGNFHLVATCTSGLCDAVGGQCDKCSAGTATGVCSSNSSRKVCALDGQSWTDDPCPLTAPNCISGQCIQCKKALDCPASQDPCSSSSCDPSGLCKLISLPKGVPCGPAGQNGVCDGSGKCTFCSAGDKLCSGNMPVHCGLDNKWESQPACSGATPWCVNGECGQCRSVDDCTPSRAPVP
jgi:hypothetical protein